MTVSEKLQDLLEIYNRLNTRLYGISESIKNAPYQDDEIQKELKDIIDILGGLE